MMIGSPPASGRRVATLALRTASAGAFLASRSWTSSATYLRRFLFWSPSGPEDWRRFPARTVAEADAPFRYPEDAAMAARLAPVLRQTARFPGAPPRAAALDTLLEEGATTAFIVIKNGAVVRETYFNGHRRDSMTRAFSASKSFAAALVGVALSEGRIRSLDDPFVRYLPELRGRRYDGITIRHLLLMTAGFRFSYGGSPAADSPLLYWHPDIRSLILDGPPLVAPPGERFHYSSYSTAVLGMVLERVIDTTLSDYFEQRVWRRIGAEYAATWSLDHEVSGLEFAASGLNARCIDLIKLGTLYLDGGRWGDLQVLPEGWTTESVAPLPTPLSRLSGEEPTPNLRYKFGWWVRLVEGRPFAFYAEGYLGQIIFVCPDKRLVIGRFGGHPHAPDAIDWPTLIHALAESMP
jgi:CubicO group peptidase (beta-lactamase class C family)